MCCRWKFFGARLSDYPCAASTAFRGIRRAPPRRACPRGRRPFAFPLFASHVLITHQPQPQDQTSRSPTAERAPGLSPASTGMSVYNFTCQSTETTDEGGHRRCTRVVGLSPFPASTRQVKSFHKKQTTLPVCVPCVSRLPPVTFYRYGSLDSRERSCV